MLYALLKRIVSFSQSIIQSPKISPNHQHLFANEVIKAQLLSPHLPHKFAQIAQIQVANLTGRLLSKKQSGNPIPNTEYEDGCRRIMIILLLSFERVLLSTAWPR